MAGPWEKFAQPQAAPAAEGPWAKFGAPKEKGFFGRVADDFDRRVGQVSEARQAQADGKQTGLETLYQTIGKGGAGTVNDIIGEGVTSGLSYLKDIVGDGYGTKEQILAARDKVAASPPAKAVGQAAQFVGDKYGQFQEAAPRAARNIESTVDLAGVFTPGPKGKTIPGAVIEGAGGVKNAAVDGLNAVADKVRKPVVSADFVKGQARDAYKFATERGGSLSPGFTDAFAQSALDITPRTHMGQILGGEGAAAKLAEKIQQFKGKAMSLDEAQEVDELLGDMIDDHLHPNGAPTKQGQKILEVQTALRNQIDNVDPALVTGGKEGFDAVKEGRRLWSKQARLRDIEKIITRAQMTQNPATSIQTGFRNLATNEKRMRGYSDQERFYINKAANGGPVVDILRVAGSRLNPIASGAVGGIGGAAAGYATSALARGGAEAVQMNKAMNVVRELSKDSSFVRPEIVTPPAPLALPAPPMYMHPDAPPLPLPGPNMPAPGGAMVQGKTGLRPQTYGEQGAGFNNAMRDQELGIDPSTRQAATTHAQRGKNAPGFDAAEATKAAQIDAAWQQATPDVQNMIMDAFHREQELAGLGVTPRIGNLGDALTQAIDARGANHVPSVLENGTPSSVKDVLRLPPKEAIKFLNKGKR